MEYLDFETPLQEVELALEKLEKTVSKDGVKLAQDRQKLLEKKEKVLKALYKKLTPWQKTCVARHALRPHTTDYLQTIFTDFFPLAGDKYFSEDAAIIGGFATLKGKKVMVIGQEKGADTESRVKHNFGMPRPDGYRKAVRLMKLAEQFHLPVITLVDTAGAYPGVDAEERGQGRAIAESIQTCLNLKVPLISCVIGEGGSGGALALAAGNVVLMLENSVYSVISPEGCASILLKEAKYASKMAEMLHLTANDLLKLGIVDEVIPEPVGGAHRFPKEAMNCVAEVLERYLKKFGTFAPQELQKIRHEKFLAMTRQYVRKNS